MALQATSLRDSSSSPPTTVQRSPWYSPVPYLFGGLAAMLGVIAFALLILACSYWKLAGDTTGYTGDVDRDVESGDAKPENKEPPVFEEKFLVIMAGEVKPTFLASPISSRVTTSFGNSGCRSNSTESSEMEMTEEKQVQRSNIGNHESSG